MKLLKYIVLGVFVCMATMATAKPVKMAHLYMFGFSASFQDSVVYMTDVQDVAGAWMDNKSKFLISRDNYSYQLKHYLEGIGEKNRVCMVFFAKSKSKAERQYLKLRKQYLGQGKNKKKKKKNGKGNAPAIYDIKYISSQDFRFEPVEIAQ